MAYLNTVFEVFIGAVAPSGIWEQIIFAFNGAIANYAWAIIVFTLVLKLLLSPLDFVNRKISMKNSKLQKVIQPELDKVKKLYGNNNQVLQQKTAEIYKKHNYNVTGSCFYMLVYLGVTMAIFFTLFSGLNNIGAFKVTDQYEKLQNEYYNKLHETFTVEIETNWKNAYDRLYDYEYNRFLGDAENAELTEEEKTLAAVRAANEYAENGTSEFREIYNSSVAAANNAVATLYKEIKESWLWVENIWKPDTPWANSILTFDDYKSTARLSFKDETEEKDGQTVVIVKGSDKEAAARAEYDKIMNPLREKEGRANGYLIIVILTVALAVVSQLAMQGKIRFKKKKTENEQKMPGGMLMTVMFPLLFGYLALMYNAVFALYMLVSSLISLCLTPLHTYLVNKIDDNKGKKGKRDKNTPDYVR